MRPLILHPITPHFPKRRQNVCQSLSRAIVKGGVGHSQIPRLTLTSHL